MTDIRSLSFQSKKFISMLLTVKLKSCFTVKCNRLEGVKIENLALYQVNFRPIVRAYMQRLGLIELINQLVLA